MTSETRNALIGIDMAWVPDKNGSGIATGRLSDGVLTVDEVRSNVLGFETIVSLLDNANDLRGVAIDAPLLINNQTGRRRCESELSAAYGSRWASTHSSNLEKYPDAAPVRLGNLLAERGHRHLGDPIEGRWQIECYPHPAIIEVFSLDKRLAYKKGNVAARRLGQARLARLLRTLERDPVLPLSIDEDAQDVLDESRIATLTGAQLKTNEDGLDAIVCLYIAGLYAAGAPTQVFGDAVDGYIVVPEPR